MRSGQVVILLVRGRSYITWHFMRSRSFRKCHQMPQSVMKWEWVGFLTVDYHKQQQQNNNNPMFHIDEKVVVLTKLSQNVKTWHRMSWNVTKCQTYYLNGPKTIIRPLTEKNDRKRLWLCYFGLTFIGSFLLSSMLSKKRK